MSKQWTNMERITADNFITDNRTDKVYISSLLNTVSGNLDKEIRSKLKEDILKYVNKENCIITTSNKKIKGDNVIYKTSSDLPTGAIAKLILKEYKL